MKTRMSHASKALIVFVALAIFAQTVFALSYLPFARLNGSEAGAFSSLERPTGLFVDSGGRIYVADTGTSRIVVYSSNLSYLTTKGGVVGNGQTELDSPEAIWVTADGKIYIADTFNHRIQVYNDYSGAFLKTIPTGSGDSYSLNRPSGVAVSPEGNVHVADTMHNRLLVFSPSGLFLSSIMSTDPFGNFVFREPSSIYIDAPRSRILVSDTGNNRVQVFTMNYSFILRIGWGEGNEGFNRPTALAVDSLGRIYVADTGNNRVQVFSENYTFLASITGAEGNFSAPDGVAVDVLGRVFISDTPGKKVVVLKVVDEELERSYTANKISAARNSYDSAVAVQSRAQSMIEWITGTGCTRADSARSFLDGSRASLLIANGSLSRADSDFAAGIYGDAVSSADAARSFADQAWTAANQSVSSAAALNSTAWNAIRETKAATTSIAEADSMNATALRLNITIGDVPSLRDARRMLSEASAYCNQERYHDAEQRALLAQGNASAAVASMGQQIDVVLIPRYTELRGRLDLAKGNVSLYALPIDLTPLEIDLSLAHTLLLDSSYEEALQKMDSVSANLSDAEARIQAYLSNLEGFRVNVSASLNSSRAQLSALRTLAGNYSQPFDDTYASIMLSQAEANLTLGDLVKANASLSLASAWLASTNSTLQAKVSEIEGAKAAIATAQRDIDAAQAASLPLLSADLASSRADLTAAQGVLYSDPARARTLAEQASFKARAEEARVNSQKPIYFVIIIILVAAIIFTFLLVTGTAAGVYAVFRFFKKKTKEISDKAIGLGGEDEHEAHEKHGHGGRKHGGHGGAGGEHEPKPPAQGPG